MQVDSRSLENKYLEHAAPLTLKGQCYQKCVPYPLKMLII